ncbi:sulfite exporter TauE/SafE family protein [Halalkalibacter nanhaiisediminis]|uniref:Probable membrane transporter protein n=1 Tax=Halalkalibacter nanhaiisediminis TaxID=688079 RepID=A0A562QB45_9BACI|nr:sulfite exporter TauE/SafE family protein [Halalkalibacter nanhaiisediminis]TWI53995.1 hypothetical protein IQ10_03305 [Halalkalibacter nanhaiisediminis]
MFILIYILVGLLAGILASLVGIGGGIVIVPVLLYIGAAFAGLIEISPQTAVGTSMVVVLFTGLSSTLAYMKQQKIDYKSALLFFSGSGLGAIVGAYVVMGLELAPFSIGFGLLIIMISFLLMVRHKLKPISLKKTVVRSALDEYGNEISYGYRMSVAWPISFIVGLLSGMFGIGGGAMMVPVMIILFGFPAHIAVATSMLMIFLSSITGSITHLALGNVEWLIALWLTAGAWFGAKFGAYLNNRMKSELVVLCLRIVLLVIGAKLVWDGVLAV